ncbi:flagellar export protein FliJ [Fictibacillus sp. 5RED26]|jgi:flagellar protein FliJ|uniref:flagellar export protein FliJ n=1 Tax=Fictibacillus TaxID=1329200 RepID=UPI0018CE2E3C|nr:MULTISPECIES: flagellar export protein FliJ [unclassified Fictibacillus]MBH0155883.1 flagellar export protein FliJ [Fictibacillus sp. 5RED26]MBH0173076.1 flagellar export protein FliJ [Fictibacillus sp. 23RED33]
MSFHFSMEKVLSVKQKEKESIEQELGEAVQAFESIAEEIYSLLKRKEDIENQSNYTFQQRIIVNDLQNTQRFLLSMTNKIKELQPLLQRARERMQVIQQRLLQQTIEVKKYEKLKERQLSAYKVEVASYENKQNDEFSVLRFAKS